MQNDPLTRAEVRRVDEIAIGRYGFAGIELMENAGRGTFDLLRSLRISGKVTICCGAGNNGGDGFVIARHLHAVGIDVRLLLLVPPTKLKGDALLSYQAFIKTGLPLTVIPETCSHEEMVGFLTGSRWIVDAMLGTGASGLPRSPYVEAIRAINTAGAAGVKIVAVDLPSGFDADAGEPFRDDHSRYGLCVRADITATFVARKVGFDRPASREFTGDIAVIDIGVSPEVIAEAKAL